MDSMEMFGLLSLIPILFYLLILGFGIYFIVRIIRFMNEKTKLDKERNEKLDLLIKVIRQGKDSSDELLKNQDYFLDFPVFIGIREKLVE